MPSVHYRKSGVSICGAAPKTQARTAKGRSTAPEPETRDARETDQRLKRYFFTGGVVQDTGAGSSPEGNANNISKGPVERSSKWPGLVGKLLRDKHLSRNNDS